MRIGLSQPAASHACSAARCSGRSAIGACRRPDGIDAPAQRCAGPWRRRSISAGLFIPDDFDALSSERRFRLMMPDLPWSFWSALDGEDHRAGAERPARHRAVARLRDRHASYPHHRHVISIGNAFKDFTAASLYRSRRARVAAGHPVGQAEAARCFLNARHVAVVIRGQNADLIETGS